MSRPLLVSTLCLALLSLCGCKAKYTVRKDFTPNYPVFFGKPMAIGGKPIAHTQTGRDYERESFYTTTGGAGTTRTGPNTETVTVVTESGRGSARTGGAKGTEFVAEATIYCSRWALAPGMIIIPVIMGKVYAGAEGKIVQPTGAKK